MKKILIVEDDNTVATLIYKKSLEHMFKDVEVTIVRSMPNAKEKIGENQYDLYIFDGSIILGHTVEILDTVHHEKVIVISADEEYIEDCEKKGIITFRKPFGPNAFKDNKKTFNEILTRQILPWGKKN